MGRGRRKKGVPKESSKKINHYEYEFVGGPRDGQKLDMAVPPMNRIRLAFPEWCNYVFDVTTGYYLYEGSELLETGGVREAWIDGGKLYADWAPRGNL